MPLSGDAPDNQPESQAMTLLFVDPDIETLVSDEVEQLLPGCELVIAFAPGGHIIGDCPVCGQSHNPAELRNHRP
jgi:hypothetical protein